MSPGPQVLSRQAALSPEPAAGAGLDRLLLARALPPQPGVWDELREPDGALRTRWRRFAACMPAARDADPTMLVARAMYSLSKRTTLYLSAAHARAAHGQLISLSRDDAGTGDTQTGITAGIQHRF